MTSSIATRPPPSRQFATAGTSSSHADASAKSLAYTIPAVERALDHDARTLYIAPQRALINDQQEVLTALADDLGFNARVGVDQYTGQLSRDEKRTIRERQPHLVLMTPDPLHYGVVPNDHLWEWLLRQLEFLKRQQ